LIPRKDSKTGSELTVQIRVVIEAFLIVLEAPSINVLTKVYVDLVVARKGRFNEYPMPQLMLKSEGILVCARNVERRRVKADAVANVRQQSQARSSGATEAVREWIDQRIRTGQTRRRGETIQ
jgi:hypothetical protein